MMAVSEKQLKANRRNAKKGGVKTAEGKAIVKHNSLKHGLLAKEIVVDTGEGTESREEFDALISDLKDQFKPVGSVEEIFVEKVAVAYWRLRRAHRYEVGLIRDKLDTITDSHYQNSRMMKDQEIDKKIKYSENEIKSWENDKKQISKIHNSGKDLKDIYGWENNWEWLSEKLRLYQDNCGEPVDMRRALNARGVTDDEIWQAHIDLCDERILALEQDIVQLNKDKQKNKLVLQVKKKLGSIPSLDDLNCLLRYETAIEKQLYKALNQLERMQRLRAGDNVPAPLKVDIDLNPDNSQ